MTAKEIRIKLEDSQTPEISRKRSAWKNGVVSYAIELLEAIDPETEPTKEILLNGAESWKQYSYGGCSLIYDCDIAERTCTPSELKRKRGGELQPNTNDTWLDVQARALRQAYGLIRSLNTFGRSAIFYID